MSFVAYLEHGLRHFHYWMSAAQAIRERGFIQSWLWWWWWWWWWCWFNNLGAEA
jgi:hypothetical protein